MLSVDVHTNPAYRVYIADNFAPATMEDTCALCQGQKVAVVTDSNVAPLYADCLDPFLAGKTVCKITVPAGEASKSPAEYVRLLNALAAAQISREDTVVALGGGVVGDLAGFAASTYMRGIAFANVPTSLLAMVDSAVGGKTAINIDYGKNLCGTFYQPRWVYINTALLASLPPSETMCGWGEIIKYAFLADSITLRDIEGDVTPQLIAKCVQIKADVVAADERESGMRKLLNLGHTVGHAIERLSGFALPHGVCVAKGLKAALDISRRYYALTDDAYRQALSIIAAKGHDLAIPYDKQRIVEQIVSDKKSNGTGIDMVLIGADLRAHIEHVPYADLYTLLQ